MKDEKDAQVEMLSAHLNLVSLCPSTIAAAMVLALLSAPCARAQSPQSADAPALAFDVASIKPDHLDGQSTRISFDADSLLTSGTSLRRLIEFAYNVNDYQLSGGPAWVDSETYEVQAKIDQDTAESIKKLPAKQRGEQLRLLMQVLLADRFDLKLSHSSKELPIYALVLLKSAPKFSTTKLATDAQGNISSNNGRLTAQAVTIAGFTEWLSQRLSRKVIDKTGLEGKYDLSLSYDPRAQFLTAASAGQVSAASDASGPSIFAALQEQLGLKLESQKGPVDTLIIESVEKPSPN